MNCNILLVTVLYTVLNGINATFFMPPMSMSYGAMHMGSPFGFSPTGFPMKVWKKFYNPFTNHFIAKPFLIQPHMGMVPPMFYPPPHMMMHMRPPMMPFGSPMGMQPPRGMGFPPRFPPRRGLARPRFPSMRRRYFPNPPTRTPRAYISARGPASSYYPMQSQTYNTYRRPVHRQAQRPVVNTAVARTPSIYKTELDEEDKHFMFYNQFDNGNDYFQMQLPYIKNRDNHYKDLSDGMGVFGFGDELDEEEGLLGALMLGGLGTAGARATIPVQSGGAVTNSALSTTALANAASSAAASRISDKVGNVAEKVADATKKVVGKVIDNVKDARTSTVQRAATAAAASALAAAASAATSASGTGISQSVLTASQPMVAISPKVFDGDDKGIAIVRTIGRNNLVQKGGNDINAINAAVNSISSINMAAAGPPIVSSPMSSIAMISKDGFDDKFGILPLMSTGTAAVAPTVNVANTGINALATSSSNAAAAAAAINANNANSLNTNNANFLGGLNTNSANLLSTSLTNNMGVNTNLGLGGLTQQNNAFLPGIGFGLGKMMDGKFFFKD